MYQSRKPGTSIYKGTRIKVNIAKTPEEKKDDKTTDNNTNTDDKKTGE